MNRIDELIKNLPDSIDAALISDQPNRRYYTNLLSSAGTVIITKSKSYLIIDARYFELASKVVKNAEVILQTETHRQIAEILHNHKAKNLAIVSGATSVADLNEYKLKLEGFNIISDETLNTLINNQRAIKSQSEQKDLQTSQDITDKTFDYILSRLDIGRTEIDIALDMEFYSRENGSEEAAFSFIIAAGPNSSKPHAVPSDRKIQKGDFVLFDFGSTHNGYRSDMTRTVILGQPTEKQKDVYNTVLNAQLKSMEQIKAGVVFSDIFKVAQDYINASPYAGLFNHGLGHSLGLEIHEPPNFNKLDHTKTVEGNVLTVEPGIYLPGEFGVRIEDFVYITKDGYTNFTGSPKELIII